MKTHLLRNVGKGLRQFHQGQAGLLLAGFLLSQGRMTTGASALFLLGHRVKTEGLSRLCPNSARSPEATEKKFPVARSLLLLVQCSVKRAEKFNILVLAC